MILVSNFGLSLGHLRISSHAAKNLLQFLASLLPYVKVAFPGVLHYFRRSFWSERTDEQDRHRRLLTKCSGKEAAASSSKPLMASEYSPGQARAGDSDRRPLGPPSPSRRPGSAFRPPSLSPESPALGRFGGEVEEGASGYPEASLAFRCSLNIFRRERDSRK